MLKSSYAIYFIQIIFKWHEHIFQKYQEKAILKSEPTKKTIFSKSPQNPTKSAVLNFKNAKKTIPSLKLTNLEFWIFFP